MGYLPVAECSAHGISPDGESMTVWDDESHDDLCSCYYYCCYYYYYLHVETSYEKAVVENYLHLVEPTSSVAAVAVVYEPFARCLASRVFAVEALFE